MYPSPYGYGYNNGFAALQTASIFSAVGLIVGIIGAIVLYTVFLKKSNEGKFTGFAGWLYEYLNFQKLSIEAVLKIVYIIVAVWVTFTAGSLTLVKWHLNLNILKSSRYRLIFLSNFMFFTCLFVIVVV